MSAATWLRCVGLCCFVVVLGALVPGRSQEAKGKKYALLVGVKSYDHSKLTDLKYTENDAEETARVLTEANYDEVVVLTTSRGEKDAKKKPTKANVERELKRLLKNVTKHDVVVIGLSGHGVQYEVKQGNKKRDESFFCPSDAKIIDSDDFDKLAATMLPFRELFKQLDDSGAGSRLLLIDACRNEAGSSRNVDTNAMPNPSKGTAALFSCKGGERAFETNKLGKGHGIFFYHVIQALKGEAKDKRGNVTWDGLTRYVRGEVSDAVAEHVGKGAKQTPHLMANVEGDPILVPPVKEKVVAKKEFTNSIGMKFVRIPATGEKGFWMGSTEEEREEVRKDIPAKEQPDWVKAEGPRHKVVLTKDFFMGVTVVTQGQYRQVMNYHPSYFSSDGKKSDTDGKYLSDPAGGKDKVKDLSQTERDNLPVELVSWEDTQDFLKKLNTLAAEKKYTVKYRLPSEAEWEYSCRGGADVKEPFTFKMPSNSITSALANFDGKSPFGGGGKGDYLERTAPVGSYGDKSKNPFGLYDMHGNVWQWCEDWYSETAYTEETRRNPTGPDKSGTSRVLRGGGWDTVGRRCRSACRSGNSPHSRFSGVGFRVAAVPSE